MSVGSKNFENMKTFWKRKKGKNDSEIWGEGADEIDVNNLSIYLHVSTDFPRKE